MYIEHKIFDKKLLIRFLDNQIEKLSNNKGVQTEIDAGYEGKNQLVLIEAKNSHTNNVIIRQLFYPFRQWSHYLNKKVVTLFFEKRDDFYYIWLFEFTDENNYNSIKLIKSKKFKINQH